MVKRLAIGLAVTALVVASLPVSGLLADEAAGSGGRVLPAGPGTRELGALSASGQEVVAIGQSVDLWVTLVNNGSSGDPSIVLDAVSLSGRDATDFRATGPSSGTVLAPGASETVQVTVTPTATGPRRAQLQVVHNGRNSPLVVRLAVRGVEGGTTGDTGETDGTGDTGGTSGPTTTTTTTAPPATGETREAWLWPFAVDSPWNTPLGSGARYSSASDYRTAAVTLPSATPWVNAAEHSHPVYRATSSDPLATVTKPGSYTVNYRIPDDARPADGSNAHMHVVEPAGRYAHEAWRVEGANPDWTVGHYAETDLHGPGVGEGGVRAYGGSALGGLIRKWELDAGTIRHALAMALTNEQLAQGPVWPATNEDGNAASTYEGDLPLGTLAAIPPSVDVTALGLSVPGLAVARALQDFGAYVVDRAGAQVLYTEPRLEGTAVVEALRTDWKVLRPLLRVVTNNGPSSVGGGGTPRVPLAPPIG